HPSPPPLSTLSLHDALPISTALHRLLLLLLLALPWSAQAGDAADYAKASPAKQAKLLEAWAVAPIPERLQLIEALRANRVAIDRDRKSTRLNSSHVKISYAV